MARTRSTFLGAPPFGARLVAVAFATLLSDAPSPRVVPGTIAPRTQLLFDSVARAYEIEILPTTREFSVGTTHGSITGSPAADSALGTYAALFAAEFSLYPPALIRRVGLERVVCCEDLAFAGQNRGAVPDFEHDTLYLDVSRGAFSPDYLRRVIHHEFFHMVDFADDGVIYADPGWARLNSAEFRYGNGGKAAQGRSTSSILTHNFPGFLDYYATTGVEEDKAEVFACLLAEPAYVEMRIQTDTVLGAKVNRMKELLARFCPDLDERFWEQVRARQRS